MKCFVQSPNLNQIENSPGMYEASPTQASDRPTTYDQLFSVIQSRWDGLPDDYVATLVNSMHMRASAGG